MKVDIKHIAKLANLELTQNQLDKIEETFPSIVEHMEKIKNLDIDNIPETARVTEEVNVLRDDTITPSLSQQEALSNAKNTHNGFFVVPNVFGEE